MDNKAIRKLESDLWEAADLLRQGSKLTSQQYCMPVLGLLFLRYAYSRFKKVEQEFLKDRPVRNGRIMPVEPSDFAEKSALFLPQQAQYSWLVNLPKNILAAGLTTENGQPMNSLGEVVNHAMELVEAQSAQLTGVLPREYTIFSDELLAELLRIFNNNALDQIGGDVIGRIYEYFLSKFAPAVASDDGVFFTPKSLVKMIVNVIEPSSGTLLDCACGSGGMFVQTGDFVNQTGMSANKAMTFFGQEKVEYNAKLCLMNMAVHGLTGVIKSGDEANTFYHDAHNLEGCCDYVMANPPFNVDKVKAEATQNAGRLPLGLPAINSAGEFGNANYLWINYFYAYLNEHGRAGFVMASSATDSKDKSIRETLIKTGHVDVMISVGTNFFYTKSLPCSLWFFDKGKPEMLQDKVLFIDARNYYTVVDRTLNEWTEWQLKNLAAIVWLYRGETEKYQQLLQEYRDALGTDDFSARQTGLTEQIKALRAEAKAAVESAEKREKKAVQAGYDGKIAEMTEMLTVAKEACWLVDKFGDGVYQDVLGLCKIAYTTKEVQGDQEGISIEDKAWSLTPGAYVGVAPVEDDGVDFHARMKEIHAELLELQAKSNELMETISKNMEEMGI
ncbi:N-6 DNA methylase [Clostridiales bacterium FE2010]|nr:N-6 DNA methylase [Clostridiales bacterium FE2010]